MSQISHSSKPEFAVLQNVQHHYILWSSPFQDVNPKVKLTYINHLFDLTIKKWSIDLPVLTFCGWCETERSCTLCCRFVYVVVVGFSGLDSRTWGYFLICKAYVRFSVGCLFWVCWTYSSSNNRRAERENLNSGALQIDILFTNVFF
jgi:hypothetical protein